MVSLDSMTEEDDHNGHISPRSELKSKIWIQGGHMQTYGAPIAKMRSAREATVHAVERNVLRDGRRSARSFPWSERNEVLEQLERRSRKEKWDLS